MPITHHVDRERNILFIIRSGSVDSQDERQPRRRRKLDPLVVPGIPVLVDCRAIESPSNEEVTRYLADSLTAVVSDLQCGPTAIVVATDAQYDMARLYQMLTEIAHPKTEVFRDYDEALRWLEENRAE